MHDRLPTCKSGGGARHVLTWKRRHVFFDGVYPAVWWPEHPCARKNGHLRIHRAVASEILGRILESFEHVHHRDEDVWNWKKSNLAILTNSEHGKEHSSGSTVVVCCDGCGVPFELVMSRICRSAFVYCSVSCSAKATERIEWPSDGELQLMMWEEPMVRLASRLGVSDGAIRHRAQRRGLFIPKWAPGYWLKNRPLKHSW